MNQFSCASKSAFELISPRHWFNMENKSDFIVKVHKISSIFGVYFSYPKNGRPSIGFICSLQLFYLFITVYFFASSFEGVTLPIYFVILFIQLVVPMFIEITINVEAYMKRSVDLRIVENFHHFENILNKSFNTKIHRETNLAFIQFVAKLVVLVIVRLLKIYMAGATFSINMAFTELVSSACDFAFTFYVDLLTIYIKSYTRSISSENFVSSTVKKDFLSLYNQSKLIIHKFSVGLFLNISFNFIALIINLYWIFIRVVYGPLRYLISEVHNTFI